MTQIIAERARVERIIAPAAPAGFKDNGHHRVLAPSELELGGLVQARIMRAAPRSWHRRNLPNIARAFPALLVARALGRTFGLTWMESELQAIYFKANGEAINYGVISRRVVTTAGVNFLVDAWQNIVELEIMKFHASGTGTGSEVVGDTALGVEATTITDRATGSLGEGASANIYQTIGTQSYTGGGAITEHGIFSVITESSGTLWDRSVFSAINVISGDSVQWTYSLTVNAGG